MPKRIFVEQLIEAFTQKDLDVDTGNFKIS